MTDIVDEKTRSVMMSGIRGKNTKPEIIVRKKLFNLGFRYKLHDHNLPGKPDLVFPKYKAVIFINGCFWHGHNCHLFKYPKTRKKFWRQKIIKTRITDKRNIAELKSNEWRILQIWECAIKGKEKLELIDVISITSNWLKSDICYQEIKGRQGKRIDE
jgi:DNA mismatch endonuclease (patch repair protein)